MSSSRVRPPKPVAEAIARIESSYLGEGIAALKDRRSEFDSSLQMKLVGISLVPDAKACLEREVESMWSSSQVPVVPPNTISNPLDEVVIGAGLHAAIYCAARVKAGYPKPVVLERGGPSDVGGAFAMTKTPTFFLNSRNRPGKVGIPGREQALNVLPAAPIQPADLSGDEFQRNSDLAFAIRMTLAMYAKVVPYSEVKGAEPYTTGISIVRTGIRSYYTRRVVWATGLGAQVMPDQHDGKKVMTFVDFMKHMDREKFPLQGLRRVAVIGAGDSGKTVIEALTGKGPSTKWSSAALDYLDKIDWYGLNDSNCYRAGWESCERMRYRNISTLLPEQQGQPGARVTPVLKRAEGIRYGYEAGYVDGTPYDLVVWCVGFERRPPFTTYRYVEYGGRAVAADDSSGQSSIGPIASLPYGTSSTQDAEYLAVQKAPENETALFRYADRTAAFAMSVGD